MFTEHGWTHGEVDTGCGFVGEIQKVPAAFSVPVPLVETGSPSFRTTDDDADINAIHRSTRILVRHKRAERDVQSIYREGENQM